MADEGLFPQHPRSGPWETLKGSMLQPHTQMPDLQDQNMGPERLNQTVSGPQSWTGFLKPNEPLTRGTGTGTK